MKFQKRLRLKDFSYIGFYKYFVTIVCNGKMPVFTEENYYEHVLRNDEDVKSIARYILENPVRKKLANDFTNYPFSGSLMFDIKEF